MRINGWEIYFLRRFFGQQRQELRAEVRRLKQDLPPDAYIHHPVVKLYTAVMRAIKEKIPTDPFAPQFALTGPLRKYGRVKKMGIRGSQIAIVSSSGRFKLHRERQFSSSGWVILERKVLNRIATRSFARCWSGGTSQTLWIACFRKASKTHNRST